MHAVIDAMLVHFKWVIPLDLRCTGWYLTSDPKP